MLRFLGKINLNYKIFFQPQKNLKSITKTREIIIEDEDEHYYALNPFDEFIKYASVESKRHFLKRLVFENILKISI